MKERSDTEKLYSGTSSRTTASARSGKKLSRTSLIRAAAYFLFSLLVTGVASLGGSFPLGLAALGAASGGAAALGSLCGVILGALFSPKIGIGGVFAAVFLISLRLTVSSSLSSGGGIITQASRLYRALADRAKRVLCPNESESLDDPLLSEKIKRRGDVPFAEAEAVRDESDPSPSAANGTVLRESVILRAIFSASAALFFGAWSVVEGGFLYYDLHAAVISVLLTPIVTYLFYAASERDMRDSGARDIGILLAFSSVSAALYSLSPGIGGEGGAMFDISALFALSFACIVSTELGSASGLLVALSCGAAGEPLYAAVYPISAAAAYYTKRLLPKFTFFAPIASSAAAVVCGVIFGGFGGLRTMFPPALFSASILFPLYKYGKIKLSELYPIGGEVRNIPLSSDRAARAEADGLRARLISLSEGMISVSAVLEVMGERLAKPSVGEVREIITSVFRESCVGCVYREKCRFSDPVRTSGTVSSMAEEASRYGTVSSGAVPRTLAGSCPRIGKILDTVNASVGEVMKRKHEADKLSAASVDYALAGELIAEAESRSASATVPDPVLTESLWEVLSEAGIEAESAAVFGERMKTVFIRTSSPSSLSLGGDELRELAERACKIPFSPADITVDGDRLEIHLSSVPTYNYTYGTCSCAASSVQVYCGGKHSCDANCDTAGEECSAENGTAGESEESEEKIGCDVKVTDDCPEEVSGDYCTAFESGGLLYMVISDGMGSGREAALTSGAVALLLERLVKAGASLECALKMLNQIVREADLECSASVDIAEIDLYGGEARFIKSGAAPSFVLRDGSIFRLQSKTVPIGIMRALDAEMIKFDVKSGDVVVMVSDGAARSYDEAPWLLDLMTYSKTFRGTNLKKCAEEIVKEAKKRGSRDDITAMVMRVG